MLVDMQQNALASALHNQVYCNSPSAIQQPETFVGASYINLR